MSREAINLSDNTLEVVEKMVEGNPGAITVIMKILDRKHDPMSMMVVLMLDDMNIRGPQIWVGYKDFCGQDIEVFVKKIKARDQGMVDAINAECYQPDSEHDGYKEKAVVAGASFDELSRDNSITRGMGL